MKRFSEQFKKQSDSIRLTAAERIDVRERMLAYMEYHPLPASMRNTTPKALKSAKSIVSQPFVTLPLNWFYVRGIASAFAIFMIVTIPVAAEYTAPGDVLYPVKVRFNEEVRSGLTLNQYEKIEWETKRLERRISEARLLASEGKLTNEVEVTVAEAVKAHSDEAKAQIATLRETDSDGAAIAEIAFATALSVQSEMLDKAADQAGVTLLADGSVTDASGSVLASVVAFETTEAEATQAASSPSFPKLMARIEIETTAAFELFTSVKNHASVDEVADIERRLKDIERKVVAVASPVTAEAAFIETQARMNMEAAPASDTDAVLLSDSARLASTATETAVVVDEVAIVETPIAVTEAEAVEILRGVMVDLRKLISFMTDINVQSSVSVEELVPITLTIEERTTAAKTKLETLRGFTATYATTTFSGAGSEKLNRGYQTVVEIRDRSETALQATALETAEATLTEGLAIVADLQSLINQTGVLSKPDATPETASSEETLTE